MEDKVILIMGTLDTKEQEILFVKEQIEKRGCRAILMDTGVLSPPGQIKPDITQDEVAGAAGKCLPELIATDNKGVCIDAMVEGAKKLVARFYKQGKIDGILGLGGGTGTSICCSVMQVLPRGFPKLMVSTIAAGSTRFGPLVGTRDITIMHSVADLQGINFLTTQILTNAAGAICGMVEAFEDIKGIYPKRPCVALSMMGTTTPGGLLAKSLLEQEGYEVVTFHQNGTGGIVMEEMIEEGHFKGVFDLSLHEIGDQEFGGLHAAIKPIRLETAGKKGIPQAVCPGCIIYYVLGKIDTFPSEMKGRKFFVHSPQLTLVRATPKELVKIGKVIACKLNQAKGPTKVFIPLKGFCFPDREGLPLYDPEGNSAFILSLKENLREDIPVIEINAHINDPEFINPMVNEFLKMMNNHVSRKEDKFHEIN